MNNMEKQKFEIVKKYIDEMDYMGLLSLGCPKNEYDGESEKIAKRINPDMSIDETALLISDVFIKSFYTGVDMFDPSNSKNMEIDESEDYKKHISLRVLETAKKICNDLLKNK